jgi:hypothetical protein
MELSLVLNGSGRELKIFIKGAAQYGKPDGLLHTLPCHDVGVNDDTISAGEDAYGHDCKCPPGVYFVGPTVPCATRHADGSVTQNNSDDPAYGCYFTYLSDTADDDFAKHGRAGIGIHGGGSAAPDPFAPEQGWYPTDGCLRLQNADNESILVPCLAWARSHNATIKLTVVWSA